MDTGHGILYDGGVMTDFKSLIREVDDWPKPGVGFKDVTPILDTDKFAELIDAMAERLGDVNTIDAFVGVESRGFIFAAALAYKLDKGLILARKPGKLPPPLKSVEYSLEYGADKLEMHEGTGRVVIVDDVVATGGTLSAATQLARDCGYDVVDTLCFIDLRFIHSRELDTKCVVTYD